MLSKLSGIFLQKGLDRLLAICPSCQLVAPDDVISSLRARQINPAFFMPQWIASLTMTAGYSQPATSVHDARFSQDCCAGRSACTLVQASHGKRSEDGCASLRLLGARASFQAMRGNRLRRAAAPEASLFGSTSISPGWAGRRVVTGWDWHTKKPMVLRSTWRHPNAG